MSHLYVDDNMTEHPKIVALSDAAFRVHMRGLSYCCRLLTDGHIPSNFARTLPPPYSRNPIKQLVDSGVWVPTPDGYLIHDFTDWNPTREEVENRRDSRSEAGKSGARARWGRGKRDGKSHSTSHNKSDGTSHAPRIDNVNAPLPSPNVEAKDASTLAHRNDQWDALEAIMGYRPTGKEATEWGAHCRDLKAAGLGRAEILRLPDLYHADMPDVTMTVRALVKHGPRLIAQPQRRKTRRLSSSDLLERARREREPTRNSGTPSDGPGRVPELERGQQHG